MTVTVSYNGNTFTFNTLTAQPFGYAETDTQAGLTARKWRITGLCTPEQWFDLLSVYDAWQSDRKEDEDTIKSGVIGTTISLDVNANNSLAPTPAYQGGDWQNVACWFSSAPSGEQAGPFINVDSEVVDAIQALETLLYQEEKSKQRGEGVKPDLGTLNIGGTVLTLVKTLETYDNVPQVSMTALGTHYVSGPPTATRVRDVEGTTDTSGWENILDWFETTVTSTPAQGSWFPVSAPTAVAEAVVDQGVKTTQYTVSIRLVQI